MKENIEKKFQQNINKCDICFGQYNRNERKPVIICGMHHTICKECMNAMRNKPICPFCRETIRFDKVVVNNYIFELLPQDQYKPNVRTQVQGSNRPYQGNIVPQSPSFAASDQPLNSVQFQYQRNNIVGGSNQIQSINHRPLQRAFFPEYQGFNYNAYPYQGQGQEFYPLVNDEYNYELNVNEDRFKGYCILLCLQIPFTFFNLYFALTQPQSQCMDRAHQSSILIVRPWFLSMGIIESVLMLFLVLNALLVKGGCFEQSLMQRCEVIIGVLAFLKLFIWAIAEINIFSAGMAQHCRGGVYAYGLFLTVVHGLFLLAVCCFCSMNSR